MDLPEQIDASPSRLPSSTVLSGARGVGEHPMSLGRPAMANAIHDATERSHAHAGPIRGRVAGDSQQEAGRHLGHAGARPATRQELAAIEASPDDLTASFKAGCFGAPPRPAGSPSRGVTALSVFPEREGKDDEKMSKSGRESRRQDDERHSPSSTTRGGAGRDNSPASS